MENVTKEDIIKIAKKVKKNVVYLLCGDEKNEENWVKKNRSNYIYWSIR